MGVTKESLYRINSALALESMTYKYIAPVKVSREITPVQAKFLIPIYCKVLTKKMLWLLACQVA